MPPKKRTLTDDEGALLEAWREVVWLVVYKVFAGHVDKRDVASVQKFKDIMEELLGISHLVMSDYGESQKENLFVELTREANLILGGMWTGLISGINGGTLRFMPNRAPFRTMCETVEGIMGKLLDIMRANMEKNYRYQRDVTTIMREMGYKVKRVETRGGGETRVKVEKEDDEEDQSRVVAAEEVPQELNEAYEEVDKYTRRIVDQVRQDAIRTLQEYVITVAVKTKANSASYREKVIAGKCADVLEKYHMKEINEARMVRAALAQQRELSLASEGSSYIEEMEGEEEEEEDEEEEGEDEEEEEYEEEEDEEEEEYEEEEDEEEEEEYEEEEENPKDKRRKWPSVSIPSIPIISSDSEEEYEEKGEINPQRGPTKRLRDEEDEEEEAIDADAESLDEMIEVD